MRFAPIFVPALTLLIGFVPADHASAQTAPAATAQTQTQLPAAPAVAPDQPTPASTAQSDSPIGPGDLVCRKNSAPTGSRLGAGSECHTEREWKMQQAISQKMLSRAQRIGLQGVIY